MKNIPEIYFGTLKQNILFYGKTDEQIKESLAETDGEIRHFKKGEILHLSGRPLQKFGLVLYGTLTVQSDDAEGNRTIMAEVTKGKTFGEALCFLKTENPDIYVSAAEDAGVLWLSLQSFFENDNDSLQNRFTKMIAKRTLDMNNRIQILSKLTLRDKIMAYFNILIKQNNSSSFEIPFNREDMATYIGADRSALSRELSKMKSEGIIDFNKNKFKVFLKKP